MRLGRVLPPLVCVALVAASAAPAAATLRGDTVTIKRIWGNIAVVSTTVVVGDGNEFEIDPGVFTDLASSAILLTSQRVSYLPVQTDPTNLSLHYIEWSDLNWVGTSGAITGVDVSFGPLPGDTDGYIRENGREPRPGPFGPDKVTFGDDWVRLEVGGYAFFDAFVQIDLIVSPSPNPPPPSSSPAGGWGWGCGGGCTSW